MSGNSWVSRLSLVDLEPVRVQNVLSSPHRLTQQLQKSFSLSVPDSYGRVRSSGDDIDVKVAPVSIPRALLLVNAFIEAAEKRGFTFAPRASDYDHGMPIVIKRQKVQFSIFEESHRVRHTHSKGRSRSSCAAPRIEFRPSGRFCFRIREMLSACQEPTFFDRPEHPLECQLSIILHGLGTAALELREKAEKRETNRRAEEQIAHQQGLANAQFRKLNEHMEDWMKSEALHRLIAQVQRKMESESIVDLSRAREWLHWATTEATRLDPTSESLGEFLAQYRTTVRPISPNDFDDDL